MQLTNIGVCKIQLNSCAKYQDVQRITVDIEVIIALLGNTLPNPIQESPNRYLKLSVFTVFIGV